MYHGRFMDLFILGNWRDILNYTLTSHQPPSAYTYDELDVIISSLILGGYSPDQFVSEFEARNNRFYSNNNLFSSYPDISDWVLSCRPIPAPSRVKQAAIFSFGLAYDSNVLVETGSFTGATPHALKDCFSYIYTLEASRILFETAKKRLAHLDHVSCLNGHSLSAQHSSLSKLSSSEPAKVLFWLDAHYSGGITSSNAGLCPLLDELNYIIHHHRNACIIIDDFRLIKTKEPGYPSENEIQQLIYASHNSIVRTDMLVAIPRSFRGTN